MAVRYRPQCESNIYHVTTRGVAKQIIFEDDEDRRFFGNRLRRYTAENEIEVYAWCLMSNHLHLLLHAPLENISKFMRQLLISYARYFNRKYERVGHLFEKRFDSTAVTTDEQLMVTLRYIHRNPEDIPGQDYKTYPWSSYREYIGKPFISATEFPASLFNGTEEFVSFHESWDPISTPKQGRYRRSISDEKAIPLMKELLGVESMASIAALDKPNRNARLVRLKEYGFPISQIARVTGIGRNIVQRAGSRSRQSRRAR